ncbi:MAG TPA: ATP-binding cassette domain-containing protein [Polyangiaceae bacterium]|nr:ATP-binding cassette domain-containing protein [Polyangiaceae bacterium]
MARRYFAPSLASNLPEYAPGGLISFREIKKSFGERRILDGVSFDVHAGEVFFLIGASGVGKSVLIKQLIGLLRPDAGEIWLDGEEVSRFDEQGMYAVRKKCAMVFQHSTLFDSMSCVDNVALPLRKHKGLGEDSARSEALALLDQVQMRKFAERFPSELGDGMKKRVAIARALGFQPSYVLFDEPTTSLDPVSARRVDRLIRDLSERLKVTSIVVSHDLPSILGIADRIVMLYKGKVRLLGTPQDFRNSDDPVIAQFINGRAEGPID